MRQQIEKLQQISKTCRRLGQQSLSKGLSWVQGSRRGWLCRIGQHIGLTLRRSRGIQAKIACSFGSGQGISLAGRRLRDYRVRRRPRAMSLRRRGARTLVTRMVTAAPFPPAQVEATAAPALLGNLEPAAAAIESKA